MNGQRATCRTCGRWIVWQFDADDEPTPYGLWLDAERMTEACGGTDPTREVDENLWHEPR